MVLLLFAASFAAADGLWQQRVQASGHEASGALHSQEPAVSSSCGRSAPYKHWCVPAVSLASVVLLDFYCCWSMLPCCWTSCLSCILYRSVRSPNFSSPTCTSIVCLIILYRSVGNVTLCGCQSRCLHICTTSCRHVLNFCADVFHPRDTDRFVPAFLCGLQSSDLVVVTAIIQSMPELVIFSRSEYISYMHFPFYRMKLPELWYYCNVFCVSPTHCFIMQSYTKIISRLALE